MGEAVAATTAVNPETSPENAPVVVAVTDMIAAVGVVLWAATVQNMCPGGGFGCGPTSCKRHGLHH